MRRICLLFVFCFVYCSGAKSQEDEPLSFNVRYMVNCIPSFTYEEKLAFTRQLNLARCEVSDKLTIPVSHHSSIPFKQSEELLEVLKIYDSQVLQEVLLPHDVTPLTLEAYLNLAHFLWEKQRLSLSSLSFKQEFINNIGLNNFSYRPLRVTPWDLYAMKGTQDQIRQLIPSYDPLYPVAQRLVGLSENEITTLTQTLFTLTTTLQNKLEPYAQGQATKSFTRAPFDVKTFLNILATEDDERIQAIGNIELLQKDEAPFTFKNYMQLCQQLSSSCLTFYEEGIPFYKPERYPEIERLLRILYLPERAQYAQEVHKELRIFTDVFSDPFDLNIFKLYQLQLSFKRLKEKAKAASHTLRTYEYTENLIGYYLQELRDYWPDMLRWGRRANNI